MKKSNRKTKDNVQQELKKRPESAGEIQRWYEKNKLQIENFADASDAIKILRDVKSNKINRTISTFDKNTLRSYLKNISSNSTNLINLSRYLEYRSQIYHRIIKYYANMLCMEARIVIPPYSLTQPLSPEETLKIYEESLVVLNNMNLQYEMLKAAIVCWREDVFFGCNYYDDSGHFIYPLDSQYCKIIGIYPTGDFAFAMDMTYFRSRQELLEALGEPFTTMYREYGGDNQKKWVPFPDEYAVCFKIRSEDWETVVPPLVGLFNSLLNLSDLEDIEAIADEQQIYKMLWLELTTLTNTDIPDDWKVSPSIVAQYYRKIVNDGIPDYTTAIISPVPIHEVSFNNDAASDTTKVQKATESVLNTSGGAQILNAASITGTTAFSATIKSDTEYAISSLLPQIQAWVNRFLSYQVSKPCKVRFFEVSTYTKGELKQELLTSGQYGLPNRLSLNSLMGINELETLSMLNLEIEVLHLDERMIPMLSSFTRSAEDNSDNLDKKEGRPTSDDTELTDDGEASRDKTDKKN